MLSVTLVRISSLLQPKSAVKAPIQLCASGISPLPNIYEHKSPVISELSKVSCLLLLSLLLLFRVCIYLSSVAIHLWRNWSKYMTCLSHPLNDKSLLPMNYFAIGLRLGKGWVSSRIRALIITLLSPLNSLVLKHSSQDGVSTLLEFY